MAKTLQSWIDTDVGPVKDKPMSWLSQFYFFRDPIRPAYSDLSYFFAPADGIILYQKIVHPDETLIDIKGKNYSLQDAMQDPSYDKESYVVGIFMTFYDVHINRIPFPGRLAYEEKEKISSYNHPMLSTEKYLVNEAIVNTQTANYLFSNQRVLNTVYAPAIQQQYYILQIADYDVDVITPFSFRQNQFFHQNRRFSQIRYGSQVDLIIPRSKIYEFEFTQREGMHIEAGLDTLIKIH